MGTNAPVIPVEVAQHVLWHFGDHLGVEPGTFTSRLLSTFAAADLTNFAKLQAAFPEYGAAFHAVSRTSEGLEQLRGQVVRSFQPFEYCADTGPDGHQCALRKGHSSLQHTAGNGVQVVAVWDVAS